MQAKRVLLVMLAALSAGQYADAVEPKSPDQFESLSEMMHYVGRRIDLDRSQKAISPELSTIADRLREPSSTVAECDQLVVGYVRKCYARDIAAYENEEIHVEDSQVLVDGLPFLLFLYKDSMTAAYEYTRLCRGSIDAFRQYARLFSDDRRDQILRYRLFVIVTRLNEGNIHNYVFEQAKANNPIENLLDLKKQYPKNEVLQKFLLDYPFERNSYLSIFGGLSRQEFLFDYFSKLFITPEERLVFLHRAGQQNPALCAGLLMRVIQQDFILKDEAFLVELLRLSAQYRMWDVVAKIRVQLASGELPQDVRATMQTARSDIQAQVELLEALLAGSK